MQNTPPTSGKRTGTDRVSRVRKQLWHARRRGLTRVRDLASRGLGPEAPRRRTLDEIGLAHGTDKSSRIHDYLRVYDRTLAHLRDEDLQMLEIGVHKGSSLAMWAEYFPRARVVGFDLDPRCKRFETRRISVVVGNQGDPQAIDGLATTLDPMLVVDDGSHRWSHQIDTFRSLWPVVRPGGYFIVEDIHTSFGDDYAVTYGLGHHQTAYDYVADLFRGLVAGVRAAPASDEFESYFRATADSVVLLPHSVIVRKKDTARRRLTVRSVAELSSSAVVRDGGSYERVPLHLTNAGPDVRRVAEALVAVGTVACPPAASAVLRDITTTGGGIAMTADGAVLSESLNCVQNMRLSSDLYQAVRDRLWVSVGPVTPLTRVPAVSGRTHVLLKHNWDGNYGHWLLDGFAKLGQLEGLRDPADCVFVLNTQSSEQMRQVVVDCMALAGVAEEQLLFLDRTTVQFEELLVLGTVSVHPTTKSPLAVRYLEQLAEKVPASDGGDRVYLSRNSSPRRRLLNEADLVPSLAAHGYRTVDTGTMTVREQVAVLRGATHVVANMGASMSNLAFSPPGVRVLSLATPAMKHDFFYDLVCHKQGRYHGLQGTAPGPEVHLGSDFTVDPADLDEALERLHAD